MANTISISALRQELWAKDLMEDVIRDVKNITKFMGEDANNIIQVSRDLQKKKGDTQAFGLVTRLVSDGVTGDDELEGNEEAMSSYNDNVTIDQIRNAVRLKGKLDAQRLVYDQISVGRENLKKWMTEFIARQIFFKLGGVTNTSLTDVNGVTVGGRCSWSNTPAFIPDADENAGSGNRYLCINTGGTTALGTSDTMTLDFITKMATKAKLASPKIQPLDNNGEPFYVCYLHPLQVRDIRKSSDWKTANEYARERSENNPIFKGGLGFWSGVLLLENEFVPWLDHTVSHSFRGAGVGTVCAQNVARALLCGKQAALMAEASNPDALVVEQFDYKNKDGVAASFIGGVQKTVFNSLEFGVIAGDTTAIA